eukprot:2493272-Rhodomonas_salina.1
MSDVCSSQATPLQDFGPSHCYISVASTTTGREQRRLRHGSLCDSQNSLTTSKGICIHGVAT